MPEANNLIDDKEIEIWKIIIILSWLVIVVAIVRNM